MLARFLFFSVVMAVFIAGASGTLVPTFAQTKEQASTFTLDRIIDLALERNPIIAGARSVIEQNEGMRTQAGAYPNPTIGGQTGSGALRDPSAGSRITEHSRAV